MFKKVVKRIGVVLLLLLIVNSIYYYLKPEGVKQYKKNQNLETIRTDWKGNVKIGKEYTNGEERDVQIMPLDLLKWKFSKNPQEDEKKKDTFRLKVNENQAFLYSKKDMIVWLGHASFFIRINGKTILTDPVFGDVSFIKRLAGLACDVNSFKAIDYILLSHGHRDHFDKNTLEVLLHNNPNVEALIPLELNAYFDKKKIKNQQAGWYQKYKTNKSIEVFFMPAKHWNRRSALDFNRNLWGSFLIRFNGKTIYFSGDTSYGDHFKETSQIFGSIDYCLLSVGAYKPEIIMKDTHMSPTEALQAFKDLNGKMMIPMHFATYDLSDEPIGEPVRLLEKEKTNYNIQFLNIGDELKI
jgi:L-ascorbate metabolism protein UlaG (beta-lactamase superfamily)